MEMSMGLFVTFFIVVLISIEEGDGYGPSIKNKQGDYGAILPAVILTLIIMVVILVVVYICCKGNNSRSTSSTVSQPTLDTPSNCFNSDRRYHRSVPKYDVQAFFQQSNDSVQFDLAQGREEYMDRSPPPYTITDTYVSLPYPVNNELPPPYQLTTVPDVIPSTSSSVPHSDENSSTISSDVLTPQHANVND